MKDYSDPPLDLLEKSAVTAARTAGAVLLERLSSARQIQFKGEINLVTDADRLSEETIVSILRSHFPDHRILAEEGSTGGGSERYRWIIDPLDGTTNYAHGYPHFAVSIGLEREGEMLLGVVHDPVLDELFVARLGEGATLNGRPLSVSSVDTLLRALVCTGFPYDRSRFPAILRRWDYFVREAQGMRRDGSAALDICYVACGRFDAFYEDGLYPWDMAAATLVVREAGGRVTGFDGREVDISAGDLVATNGPLHEAMLEGLRKSSLEEQLPLRQSESC